MKRLYAILGGAVLLGGGSAAFANDPVASVSRDAERLAECMKALDAACLVSLSNVDGYQRISPVHSDYPKAQARFFAALARIGGRFTQYDVSPPPRVYSSEGLDFAFVPYAATLEMNGRSSHNTAFLIAVSTDGGDSWKFVDGARVTTADIRQIVPQYSGQVLPPVLQDDAP